MKIADLRREYHQQICQTIIRIQRKDEAEFHNFADGDNKNSCDIAWGIVNQLACSQNYEMISGQTAGSQFERLTRIS